MSQKSCEPVNEKINLVFSHSVVAGVSVSQSISPPHWSRLKYLNNNHLTIYYCCSQFVQCSPTMILYCSLISSLSLLGSEADGFQWFSRSLCQAAPAAGSLQGLDLLSQHGFVPAFIYLFILISSPCFILAIQYFIYDFLPSIYESASEDREICTQTK